MLFGKFKVEIILAWYRKSTYPFAMLPVTLLPCNLAARDSVRPGGKADRACVRLGSSGGMTRPNYKLLSGLSVCSQSSTDLR